MLEYGSVIELHIVLQAEFDQYFEATRESESSERELMTVMLTNCAKLWSSFRNLS